MLLCSFTVLFLLLGSILSFAHAQPTTDLPLGAEWQSTLAQAEQLPGLERAAGGDLKAAATIRSGPEIVYCTPPGRRGP